MSASVEDLVTLLLVVAGHLHPQVAATGVDHDVKISFVVLVHLNEVVPVAQGADALFRPEQVHMLCTAQLVQVDLAEVAVGPVPDGEAGGDFLIDQLVQLLEFHMTLPDAGGLHATADVHPRQVGHHLIGDGHGGANGTSLAGVDVGHKPDTAARCERLVAQLLHLGDGCVIHNIGEDFSRVKLALYLYHNVPSV